MNANDGGRPKLGQSYLMAMAKLGARELGAAFFTQSNVAQYGYGLHEPQAVSGREAASREPQVQERGEEPQSQLAQYMNQAELSHDDRGREAKEIERDV